MSLTYCATSLTHRATSLTHRATSLTHCATSLTHCAMSQQVSGQPVCAVVPSFLPYRPGALAQGGIQSCPKTGLWTRLSGRMLPQIQALSTSP